MVLRRRLIFAHIPPAGGGASISARGGKGFDFQKTFGKPAKVVNDALMQALGGYRGGRMLFLGLGTGLGSAMIVDGELEPMELGHLPYRRGKTYEDYAGEAGRKRRGNKKWRKHVTDIVMQLTAALEPDEVLIGGGNVGHLDKLPPKNRAAATTQMRSMAGSGCGERITRATPAAHPKATRTV